MLKYEIQKNEDLLHFTPNEVKKTNLTQPKNISTLNMAISQYKEFVSGLENNDIQDPVATIVANNNPIYDDYIF